MKGVIDIIENGVALILAGEDGTDRHYIPASSLKSGLKEGERVTIPDDELPKLENSLREPMRGVIKQVVELDESSNQEWMRRFNVVSKKIRKNTLAISDFFPEDVTRGSRPKADKDGFKIVLLNVGQGDSIYIEFADGANMLIDSADNKSAGAISTYEFLKNKNISKIDVFILSHPHIDHIEGTLNFLLDSDIELKSIFRPDYAHLSQYYHEILNKMISKRVQFIDHLNSQSENFTMGGATFFVLSPSPEINKKQVPKINNSSIVLKMESTVNGQPFGMLFAGDIEVEGWDKIIAKYGTRLKADILKISHHGSITGTNKKILDAVKPRDVIISVGQDNMFNHPHDSVLKLLKRSVTGIYRTDHHGTIEINNANKSYQIKCGVN